MVDLSHLALNDEEPIEVSHEFVVDLHCLVVENHRLTLEAINKAKEEDLTKYSDPEDYNPEPYYEDRLRAANNLALVAVVTRFHHWITRFVGEFHASATPYEQRGLKEELSDLSVLGNAPVPAKFFEDLAEVRHSVIHADSKAQWTYRNKPREVSPGYRNAWGIVEVSEKQLEESIAKAIQQVQWYDDQLRLRRRAP